MKVSRINPTKILALALGIAAFITKDLNMIILAIILLSIDLEIVFK